MAGDVHVAGPIQRQPVDAVTCIPTDIASVCQPRATRLHLDHEGVSAATVGLAWTWQIGLPIAVLIQTHAIGEAALIRVGRAPPT